MERIAGLLIGWIVGGVVRLIAAAWWAVARVVIGFLSSRRPLLDPHVETLTRWRSAIGLLLVIVANLLWNPDPERLMFAWSESVNRALLVPIQVAVAVLVAAAVLVVLARNGQRRRMVRAAVIPVRVVGVSVLALAAWFGCIAAWNWLMPLVYGLGDWRWIAIFAMLTLNLCLSFAGLVGIVHGGRAIVRDRFRARDAHPAMGAIVIAVLSLWTLGLGLAKASGHGVDPVFPVWASVCLLVVGPLVNIALSAYELIRLRRRFGVSMRDAME
ncbi:hypothetical protein ASG80_12605 [Agromyces sp. Soil535]|nr:hypothetical protein ASG80_12605 [Agromyces sp. Soil535]